MADASSQKKEDVQIEITRFIRDGMSCMSQKRKFSPTSTLNEINPTMKSVCCIVQRTGVNLHTVQKMDFGKSTLTSLGIRSGDELWYWLHQPPVFTAEESAEIADDIAAYNKKYGTNMPVETLHA